MVTSATFPWPSTPPAGAQPEIDGPVNVTGGLDWIAHTTWWSHGLDRPRLIGLHLLKWTRGPWPADLPHLCQTNTSILTYAAAKGATESGLCAHCFGMLPLTVMVSGNRKYLFPGRQGAACMDCKKLSIPAKKPTTGHGVLHFETAWAAAQKRLLDLPNADT